MDDIICRRVNNIIQIKHEGILQILFSANI